MSVNMWPALVPNEPEIRFVQAAGGHEVWLWTEWPETHWPPSSATLRPKATYHLVARLYESSWLRWEGWVYVLREDEERLTAAAQAAEAWILFAAWLAR